MNQFQNNQYKITDIHQIDSKNLDKLSKIKTKIQIINDNFEDKTY